MKINRAMKGVLREVRLDFPLHSALEIIVNRGFDCTGYECFVNSLHVDDYDSVSPFTQAIMLVKEVFTVWNTIQRTVKLVAVVSADQFNVVTKFHVQRPGQQWLSDNINGYDDPVMSIDSNEDIISEIAEIR
ncbi:hypothetical protein LL998_18295 [Burkholderia ambifaria]|uniref:hypothetical protein n=1 Tax=Burkholderia ambifaria TaxID=152480 RepID=UPI001E2BC10B|nr:hypothetical protein [Burkholderia ambifaria]UEP37918.1 hypothetical protein LL998_18295 [Burkholderia ambifaria]